MYTPCHVTVSSQSVQSHKLNSQTLAGAYVAGDNESLYNVGWTLVHRETRRVPLCSMHRTSSSRPAATALRPCASLCLLSPLLCKCWHCIQTCVCCTVDCSKVHSLFTAAKTILMRSDLQTTAGVVALHCMAWHKKKVAMICDMPCHYGHCCCPGTVIVCRQRKRPNMAWHGYMWYCCVAQLSWSSDRQLFVANGTLSVDADQQMLPCMCLNVIATFAVFVRDPFSDAHPARNNSLARPLT